MFTVTTPAAPVTDKDEALNALWAFVEGIGFDPASVVTAYVGGEAYSLGMAVGATKHALSRVLPPVAAEIFGASELLNTDG